METQVFLFRPYIVTVLCILALFNSAFESFESFGTEAYMCSDF